MANIEEKLVILLRKILALSLEEVFDPTLHTDIGIILELFRENDKKLFKVLENFIFYQEELHISEEHKIKEKASVFGTDFPKDKYWNSIDLLISECRHRNIKIDYELGQILE